MGNRANVVFADKEWRELSPAIYLHWNGGPESIYAFLAELDRRNIRADQCYEAARFTQIVGDFFDGGDRIGGLSLGLANVPEGDNLAERLNKVQTDPGDNGFFVVCREAGGRMVRRFVEEYRDEKGNQYPEPRLVEMTDAKVKREADEAAAHDYAKGFREKFEAMTAGKKIEA